MNMKKVAIITISLLILMWLSILWWGHRYQECKKVEEISGELRDREPFYTLLHPEFNESLPAALEMIKELQEDMKKLKRHKHDTNGDVMVRI